MNIGKKEKLNKIHQNAKAYACKQVETLDCYLQHVIMIHLEPLKKQISYIEYKICKEYNYRQLIIGTLLGCLLPKKVNPVHIKSTRIRSLINKF